ncbi:hypothetical protein SCHPADRAFT_227592 [Schizopora paradoxa]|uniref:Uncharacterized protein n=1 Tax=Schizopora paradoxa TaxID=27342 RepID=A0A0H2S2V6_9AGAM|nr:hypothetical protein SCHPADRAFT_227592 [Schizopora paradoxa]
MSTVNAINFAFFATVTNPFFASTTGTNSLIAHVVSVSLMSRLMLNLKEESHLHSRSARSLGTETAAALTDTHLVFTTRILGNLTSELITRADEERELDEYYGTRRRWNNAPSTVTSAYTGRSLLDGTESTTSRTCTTDYSGRSCAGAASLSTSHTGSRRSNIGNVNAIASGSGLGLSTSFVSNAARPPGGWDDESPSTAVDDTHPLRNFAYNSPLSPLSPGDTYVEEDVKSTSDEGGEDGWKGAAEAAEASGLSIEMTRLDRRRNSVNNDQHLREQRDREDLYHDHYRIQTHGQTQEPD